MYPLPTIPPTTATPSFRREGARSSFASDRDGDEELYIKNADGSGDSQQITFNRKRDVEPDWQPIP